MLYLMNSKNKHTKKDLRLHYSQGKMMVYPSNIEGIVSYLSTQYPNNKPANQRNGKKEDKHEGFDPKSEVKDNNMSDTAGTHVGDITTTEESTAPSVGASIGALVLETNKQFSCPSCSVKLFRSTSH